MDCFNSLPAEIRVQILSEFASPSTIQNTIRASPAMLHGYVANKEMIRRRSLSRLISGNRYNEILQDALTFLDLDTHSFDPFYVQWPYVDQKNHVIDYYIHKWATRSHRDPFQEGGRHAIRKLWRFFSRIIMLAEDYISKFATSDPQAYFCLPRISKPTSGLRWDGKQTVPDHMTLDNLYGFERHYLLWAFTKFEILSRLQQPRFDEPWHADTFMAAFRALSHHDRDSLRSIDAYVRVLFGAVCLKCIASDDYSKDSSSRGQVLPSLENLHLHQYICPEDMRQPCGTGIMRKLVGLSHFGFDLVVYMLMQAEETRTKAGLRRWFFRFLRLFASITKFPREPIDTELYLRLNGKSFERRGEVYKAFRPRWQYRGPNWVEIHARCNEDLESLIFQQQSLCLFFNAQRFFAREPFWTNCWCEIYCT